MTRFTRSQVKKIAERFRKKLYFNKAFRDYFKENSLQIKKHVLKNYDTSWKPSTKKEIKKRQLQLDVMEIVVNSEKLWRDAENDAANRKITKATFVLYKKNGSHAIRCRYFKPSDNQYFISVLVFPDGLPTGSERKKVRLIRSDLSLSGYKELNKGKLSQSIKDFDKFSHTYHFDKHKLTLLFCQRGRINDKLWVEQKQSSQQ